MIGPELLFSGSEDTTHVKVCQGARSSVTGLAVALTEGDLSHHTPFASCIIRRIYIELPSNI